jgi:hypothetical protein
MESDGLVTAPARTLPPRDARGRFVARAGAAARAPRVPRLLPHSASGRVRSLPSRDARGRFVAFPTTSVPSWYVFCADGYRILGDVEVVPMQREARPVPHPQPLPLARVVRRRRPPMQWGEVVTWLLMATFVVVVGWHGLHLQLPHR